MKKNLLLIGLFFMSIALHAQLWSSQTTNFAGTSVGVDQVSTVDSITVWINGFNGDGSGIKARAHSRTQDGGLTWTAGSYNGMTGNIYPQVLAGVDYSKAFCVAYDSVAGAASFWKTTDGGSNWALVTGVMNTGTTTFADGVMFWNSSKGFCYGDPVSSKFDIYNTTDGGTTWNAIAGGSISAPLTGEYGYNGPECTCKVPGGVAMFITNKGRVFKTTNYGATWAITPTAPFTVAYSGKIYASSANFIIVAATLTQTATTSDWKYTTDGGTTWNTYSPTGNFYQYQMCYVPGSPNMFVATSPFTSTIMGVAYSMDGGLSWSDYQDALLQPTGTNIQCLGVGFHSPRVGWVGNYGSGSNTILKYYNPSSTVGVPTFETINDNDVSIYPNPANDVVNFSINGINKTDFTVKVIDITGKIVYQEVMNVKGVAKSSFNCSKIAKGLYIVNISTENTSTNKKLMIN